MQLLKKLFSINGRVTRLEYLLFGLLPFILFFIIRHLAKLKNVIIYDEKNRQI